MGALPILTYHSIDPSGSVVSVPPALFRSQMASLAAAGWSTLRLAEAVRVLESGRPVPARHLVLTFDDAYRNVYTEAFPVLQLHGFHATVFAISRWMGKTNEWPGHEPPLGVLPLMTWEEAREMQRHGVEVAAHTRTHPDLTQISAAVGADEIVGSKRDIEDRLGTAVETFAYPYGSISPEAVEVVREHFIGACTTRLGKPDSDTDLHLLPRIDAYYVRRPSLGLDVPPLLLDGYLSLRQRLRDIRALLT